MTWLALPEDPKRALRELDVRLSTSGAGLIVADGLDHLCAAELEVLLRALDQLPDNGTRVVMTLRRVPVSLRRRSDARVVVLAHGLSPRAGSTLLARLAHERAPEIAGAFVNPEGEPQRFARHLAASFGGHPAMIEAAIEIAATSGMAGLASVTRRTVCSALCSRSNRHSRIAVAMADRSTSWRSSRRRRDAARRHVSS